MQTKSPNLLVGAAAATPALPKGDMSSARCWGTLEVDLECSQHVGLADPLASGQESVFHITNAEVTVGRGAQCEWRMSKRLTWISNRHFTLGRDATGNVYIRDHSSNGTTVSLPSLPRRHHLSNAA